MTEQQDVQRMQEAKKELQAFQQQVQVLEERLEELQETEQAIQDLENVSEGDTVWAELGKGVRVKAEIKDLDSLMTDVGSDVMREKKPVEAEEVVKKQKQRVEETKQEMSEEIQNLQKEVQQLQQKLQQQQQ